MIDLLSRIRSRLAQGAFPNEAAVSHGILVPLLQALDWDPAEPDQVMPEYSSGRGRVDFALCGSPARPSVFIEVKGVGRSLDGDRQLFEYAFHEGVPLCVLTDGREWSFYLPSGQGSYEDRRVYRLQLDDRSPEDSEATLQRYLGRERVRSGAALDAATQDYRDAAAKREAARVLPRAWSQLVQGPEDLLVELLSDQAEALGGFRPEAKM
jgi:predicted type IV restriction endonuclease